MTRDEFQKYMVDAEIARQLEAELRRAESAFSDAKKSIAERRTKLQSTCTHPVVTRACAETEPQCDICGAEL